MAGPTKPTTEVIDNIKRAREEEYFRREEQRLLEALREKRRRAEEGNGARVPLGMCPRCGKALEPQERDHVAIDVCPGCGGVWLDPGELEAIAGREGGGWLRRLLG